MWILLAVASALCLGFYDVFKKLSVAGNNVLVVLFSTLCSVRCSWRLSLLPVLQMDI